MLGYTVAKVPASQEIQPGSPDRFSTIASHPSMDDWQYNASSVLCVVGIAPQLSTFCSVHSQLPLGSSSEILDQA